MTAPGPRRGALVAACTALAMTRGGMHEAGDELALASRAIDAVRDMGLELPPDLRPVATAADAMIRARLDERWNDFDAARWRLFSALALYWRVRAKQSVEAL